MGPTTVKPTGKKAPTILDVLNANLEPCYNRIISHLDVPDMLRLFATCRTIHSIYYCIFNIDAHLRQFFKDPLVFRQAMADYDLIVGGSVALKLFAREKWTTKDLDVYTNSLSSLRKTAQVLTKEKFKFAPFPWQSRSIESSLANAGSVGTKWRMFENADVADERIQSAFSYKSYQGQEIRDVYRFENKSAGLHIDVILTKGPALQAIIGGYYATYIMNFFTYNRAYNLFPYHTIIRKEGFQTVSDMSEKREEAMKKYRGRGYKITSYGTYHSCKIECPIRPHRRVGDMFTWTIDLPINGIRLPSNPIPLETYTFGIKAHRSWRTTTSRSFASLSNLKLEMAIFQHKKLEFPLLVDKMESAGCWKEFLNSMLQRVTAQEADADPELADPWLQKDTIINGQQQYFDRDVEGYYKFWYQYIMPREAIWKGQYPMLQ
ncbi:hypothetical protein TWF281_003812 [Arthrobotrys megalospora]